jgi:hypothetical protein
VHTGQAAIHALRQACLTSEDERLKLIAAALQTLAVSRGIEGSNPASSSASPQTLGPCVISVI